VLFTQDRKFAADSHVEPYPERVAPNRQCSIVCDTGGNRFRQQSPIYLPFHHVVAHHRTHLVCYSQSQVDRTLIGRASIHDASPHRKQQAGMADKVNDSAEIEANSANTLGGGGRTRKNFSAELRAFTHLIQCSPSAGPGILIALPWIESVPPPPKVVQFPADFCAQTGMYKLGPPVPTCRL
jgi:hypothetical protein